MTASFPVPDRFTPTSQDFRLCGDNSASDLRTIANERPRSASERLRLLDVADALDATGHDSLFDVPDGWGAPALPEQWTPEKGMQAMEDVLNAAVQLEQAISRVVMLNASAPYDAERESHIKINLRDLRLTMRRLTGAWSVAVGSAYRGFVRR